MSDIAVIGDRDSILGFKALGFDVYEAAEPDKAAALLHRLAKGNTAIIYLTEQLAQHLQPDIRQYQSRMAPAILLIPGSAGSLGIGLQQIRTLVEKAVGMDILKENDAPENKSETSIQKRGLL